MPDLVTIEAVEIGSVGMQWHASNGDLTLTMANLRDVMVAANDDPHIVTPRLKLGHEGWPDMDGLDNNPFGTSAEPALGRAVNFRLTNDGATLVADYVDVPAWLPAAYPGRSGEWLGEVDPVIQTGVQTPGGKTYSMVLTAVALLGVCAPAIADLEDLQSFVTTGTTKAGETTVTATQEEPVAGTVYSDSGSGVTLTMTAPVATRADIDTVQRSFWSEFATGDRFWWWPRDIYTDPNEVLADDDEGHLFRVPFTSNDAGDIDWGDPVRVRVDLVDLPPLEDPAAAVAVVAASHRAVLATEATTHRTFATAAAARPAERTTQRAAEQVAATHTNPAAEGGPNAEEATPMDITVRQALARQHGLDPDTATEEDVNAAVLAAAETEPPEEPETPEQPEGENPEEPETPEVEEPEAELEPMAAKAQLLERRLAELEGKERSREEAAASAAIDERVKLVRAATSAGIVKPHEVDTWTERVKDTEKGEAWATVLRDLSPVFGTSELGANPSEDKLAATVASGDPLPDNVSLLTPSERAQRAAA